MGLLIKLQNGDTQLKSLKFGKDRPGGGDSGQPFLQEPINAPLQNPDYYNDFVLRGGIEAPIAAAQDVARLTKYLASPKGLLFISKQELLSRTGTKTEASKGIQYLGGALNEGVYNPFNTLAQAGTGFLGAHFDKQEIKKYQDVIAQNQPKDTFNPDNNRLTQLSLLISQNRAENNFSFVKGYRLNANNSLISYGGGPDSDLGVGKTYINFATSNYNDPDSIKTLLPKPNGYLTPNKDYYIPSGSVYKTGQELLKSPDKYLDELTDTSFLISRNDLTTYLVGKKSKNKLADEKWDAPVNATFRYAFTPRPGFENVDAIYPTTLNAYALKNAKLSSTALSSDSLSANPSLTLGIDSYGYSFNTSVYNPGSLIPRQDYKTYLTKEDPSRESSKTKQIAYPEISPIESKIMEYAGYEGNFIIPLNVSGALQPGISPLVPAKRRDLNPTTPGLGVNKRFVEYNRENATKDASELLIYSSDQINNNINDTEIVPFNIAIVDPETPSNQYTISFPTYVKSFSDSYGAEWNAQSYMGRAEKFYKYNSFSRDINFSFIVASTSRGNLTTNYNKLNRLASSLAPTYTSQGYMAGNLHRLTFGNYVKGQYGILESVDYTIMDESPWETRDGQQLPFYIEVSCKFIPIHNFRPEYQYNAPTGSNFINQTVAAS
jgi:hypothetical protein